MTKRRRRVWPKFAVISLLLGLGCGQTAGSDDDAPSGGTSSSGGDAAGTKGGSAGKGSSGSGGSDTGSAGSPSGAGQPGAGANGTAGADGAAGTTSCVGDEMLASKRLVRLSFAQISNSIRAMFGDALGDQIDQKYELGSHSLTARAFPPLASAAEGSTIVPKIWQDCSQIAADVGAYTVANLDAVTHCGSAASDDCARAFVGALADRVFRRPASTDELASFAQVFDEVKAVTGSNEEALGAAVEALLQSPQFLYRTEFGEDAQKPGALDAFELASELSYFLGDAPPDAELLGAAERGVLTSDDELAAQSLRILRTPAARSNLEQALLSRFGIPYLDSTIVDDAGFTTAVRDAARYEAESFLRGTLWSAPLSDILTSRRGALSPALADLYGVSLPGPAPSTGSPVELDLPPERAGLLTRAAFLIPLSFPDRVSVVRRGLTVNATLLCATIAPEGLIDRSELVGTLPPTATRREQTEYRLMQPACGECHAKFENYGLALDRYDLIGRYRTVDELGRPIDPSVTLPSILNDATAADAVEMERLIAQSPAFAQCMAKHMLSWAFMDNTQISADGCVTKQIANALDAGDQSFTSLLRQIAISRAFRERTAE